MATPFIKWAGGKRQLMKEIIPRLPEDLGVDGNRHFSEPFIGGGALMFNLFELNLIDTAVISDFNPELILCYRSIQKNVQGVIDELQQLQEEYNIHSKEERKDKYFQVRKEFNEQKGKIDFSNFSKDWCKRASQLIYLNKTGFNGLFRVNKKGELNVPPAGGNDKNFLDIENLRSVSKVLRNVKILQGDYTICEDYIDKDTFVYFDPPYRPLKSTSFTTYSTHVFDDKEQERLANFAVNLGNKGAKVMLSNSDPKNVDPNDDFFDNLYSMENGFKIDRVQAIRAINSKGDGRGRISELLIMNY